MKVDGPLAPITKSLVPLNTCPVGDPSGMVTTSETNANALPFTSPRYRVALPVSLAETQNAPPVGLSEIPQPLTRLESCFKATPGWSETRLVTWYVPVLSDGTQR